MLAVQIPRWLSYLVLALIFQHLYGLWWLGLIVQFVSFRVVLWFLMPKTRKLAPEELPTRAWAAAVLSWILTMIAGGLLVEVSRPLFTA